MHPSTEELLLVRDGEAPPHALRHVAECPACAREVGRLRALREAMRDLPAPEPRRDLWPDTLSRIRAGRAMRRWLGLAAAAMLLVGAGAVALLLKDRGLLREGPPTDRYPDSVAQGPRTVPPPAATRGADAEVERLIRSSQRLETLVGDLEDSAAVVSGRQAAAGLELEGRLANLDLRLESVPPGQAGAGERLTLWKERVRLLGALADVRSEGRRAVEI